MYVSAVLRECGTCVRQCSIEGVWYMCTSVQRWGSVVHVYVSAALGECGTCVRQCSVEGVWYMCTAVQR